MTKAKKTHVHTPHIPLSLNRKEVYWRRVDIVVTKVALDSENLYLNVITRQDKYLRFSYPIFKIQTVIGSTNVIIHIMKKDLLNNVHDDKKLKTKKNARFPECFKWAISRWTKKINLIAS